MEEDQSNIQQKEEIKKLEQQNLEAAAKIETLNQERNHLQQESQKIRNSLENLNLNYIA